MSQYGAMWAAKLPIQDTSSDESMSNVTEVRAEQMQKKSMFSRPRRQTTTESNPDNFTTNYVRLVQEMIAEYKQEMGN